jgi:flagellar motor switch protein FliG
VWLPSASDLLGETFVLTGAEKAVLFLLSLDEAVATPIVSELAEADLRKLRAVASTMREVPAEALDEAFREFLDRSSSAVAVPRGGLSYLKRLSVGALGEARAREVFEDGVTSPLARLEGAPPDAVAALLVQEPPQLIAAILARLEPNAAARILAALPLERQSTLIAHVSQMTELPAKVVEDVASALANELPTDDAATLISVDGVAKAAEMLNAAGRDASSSILRRIEDENAEIAAEVRNAMFTFDDLARLDPRAMRELLREVPSERLTIALKGAKPEVMTAIFGGLSGRAAELIRDDLEVLGKVRKADLDAARREMVEAALRLESDGRIDLGRDET